MCKCVCLLSTNLSILITGNGSTITTFESTLNVGSAETNTRYYSLTFGIVVVKITSSPVRGKEKHCLLSAH